MNRRSLSPKQQIIRAAEAVIDAAVLDEDSGTAAVPIPLLDLLRKKLDLHTPKPMPDGLSMTDPEYFRVLARRGTGNRVRGESKRLAGALGGLTKHGPEPQPKERERSNRWGRCACGTRVVYDRVKRKFGNIGDRGASWAECPTCHKAVGPHVWDEDLEV